LTLYYNLLIYLRIELQIFDSSILLNGGIFKARKPPFFSALFFCLKFAFFKLIYINQEDNGRCLLLPVN